MKLLHEYTFADVEDDPPGTKYHDDERATQPGDPSYTALSRRRFLIVKGGSSCCAYLGVPAGHALIAEFPDYGAMPLQVHGGLTFGGRGKLLDSFGDWHYWGWDYAHFDDKLAFGKATPEALRWSVRIAGVPVKADADQKLSASPWPVLMRTERAWTPLDVWADSQDDISAFERLMLWAERRAFLRRIRRSSKTQLHHGRHPAMLRALEARITTKPKAKLPRPAEMLRRLKGWSLRKGRNKARRKAAGASRSL